MDGSERGYDLVCETTKGEGNLVVFILQYWASTRHWSRHM
jgi:hypothetical protein